MRLLACVLLSAVAAAAEFPLGLNGIWPIIMETYAHSEGAQIRFRASARNASNIPIRRATWCVLGVKHKIGCTFTFSTTGALMPGELMRWDMTVKREKGLPKHTVTLLQVSPITKLDPIRKVYVAPIEGNSGEMIREQLMAILANSGRFELVEDAGLADASLKGRSETREAGSRFKESGRAAGVGSALGSGSAIGYLGTVAANIGATAVSSSRSATEGKTETIMAEKLVLRLVSHSGESVWAWDDTKTCSEQKVKCALGDLVLEATR